MIDAAGDSTTPSAARDPARKNSVWRVLPEAMYLRWESLAWFRNAPDRQNTTARLSKTLLAVSGECSLLPADTEFY